MKTKAKANTEKKSVAKHQPEAEKPPAVPYPTTTELAMLAVQMLEEPQPDENNEKSHCVDDYVAAVHQALGLWRCADNAIQNAQEGDKWTWKTYVDNRAKQKDYEILNSRLKERVKESPAAGEPWAFGKAASKLIPPGMPDPAKQLEELLKKEKLPKFEAVDHWTFNLWGVAVERDLLGKSKALKRQQMKDLRAKGVEKQKKEKMIGTPKAPVADVEVTD